MDPRRISQRRCVHLLVHDRTNRKVARTKSHEEGEMRIILLGVFIVVLLAVSKLLWRFFMEASSLKRSRGTHGPGLDTLDYEKGILLLIGGKNVNR
jgi:hypothetical protein